MTVGLDGKIFLPLVGEFEVSGKTIDELRQEILQKMTGAVYRDRIEGESVLVAISGDEVLVEVAAYRPIYIDGDVARAGEIPFSVGITVRQAIAAAHGFADQDAQNRAFADDNAIAIRARIAALQTETVYHRAIANGTTLVDEAALARIEVLAAPIDEVLDRMNQRLENANVLFEIEMNGIDRSIAMVRRQLDDEQSRVEYIRSIADLAKVKVERVQDLVLKGFAPTENLTLSWTQYLAIVENLRGVEQYLEGLQSEEQELQLQRNTAEAERRETAFSRLAELEATLLQEMGRLEVATAEPATSADSATPPKHIFRVHRQTENQYREFVADTGTRLMPGDVLSVQSREEFVSTGLRSAEAL